MIFEIEPLFMVLKKISEFARERFSSMRMIGRQRDAEVEITKQKEMGCIVKSRRIVGGGGCQGGEEERSHYPLPVTNTSLKFVCVGSQVCTDKAKHNNQSNVLDDSRVISVRVGLADASILVLNSEPDADSALVAHVASQTTTGPLRLYIRYT